MKVKSDFVTNSSSTAYVIMIPNDFELDQNEVMEEYGSIYIEEYESEDQEVAALTAVLPEMVEKVKCGEHLWCYGDEGEDPNLYYILLNICEKHGFVLASDSIGGEGNNTIFSIPQERVEGILLNNINIEKILNRIGKGETLCCEK